ncbi:MAG: nuclease-related domain-containing protein [Pseudomonadota bacterium]
MIDYFFPAALMILPIILALAALQFARQRLKTFMNPLTGSLARPPASHLASKLGTEQLAVGYSLLEIALPVIAPIMLYVQLHEKIIAGEPLWLGFFALVLLLWLASAVYCVFKLSRRIERIRSLRLAYECELAVGQELDQLMLDGFHVFHNLKLASMHIDHVIVGQAGVFAVETWGRTRDRLTSRQDVKQRLRVVYEGGVLKFPGEDNGGVSERAAKAASATEKWLSEAIGFEVSVRPVVILPGWYIENKDRPEVPVINSGYIQRYFQSQRQLQLNRRDMQQIANQVDRKIREPVTVASVGHLAKTA